MSVCSDLFMTEKNQNYNNEPLSSQTVSFPYVSPPTSDDIRVTQTLESFFQSHKTPYNNFHRLNRNIFVASLLNLICEMGGEQM